MNSWLGWTRALLKIAHSALTILAAMLALIGFTAQAEDVDQPITIFAAASLSVVMPELASAWADKTGRHAPRFSFGPSGTMARQVSMGAPVDIYMSANKVWTDWLLERNIGGNVQTLAYNRLALIAAQPTQNTSSHTDLSKLLSGRRLIIADAATAPLGVYSQQALKAVGVSGMTTLPARDARTVMTLIQRGAGDFAVVYASDAHRLAPSQTITMIDPALHDPIAYSGLTISTDPQAKPFIAWLVSADAKAIWRAHGFQP